MGGWCAFMDCGFVDRPLSHQSVYCQFSNTVVILIDHARRVSVWLAPQSGAGFAAEGHVGAGIRNANITRTTRVSRFWAGASTRFHDQSLPFSCSSRIIPHCVGRGGTPERLNPQARTAVYDVLSLPTRSFCRKLILTNDFGALRAQKRGTFSLGANRDASIRTIETIRGEWMAVRNWLYPRDWPRANRFMASVRIVRSTGYA